MKTRSVGWLIAVAMIYQAVYMLMSHNDSTSDSTLSSIATITDIRTIHSTSFTSGSGEDIHLKGCQITMQGIGDFSMDMFDSNERTTYHWYQQIDSTDQPSIFPCPAVSYDASSTVRINQSSLLNLSLLQLYTSDSLVTLISVNQSTPDWSYFPDPAAVVTVYGMTHKSLPLTSYQITAVSHLDEQTLYLNADDIDSSLWSRTFGNFSNNIDYVFSIRSLSQLSGSFHVHLTSEHSLTAPISFLCPPGYYANERAASSANCSPCPLSTDNSGWGATCIFCSGFTPLIGSTHCSDQVTHWPFDTRSHFQETLSFYNTEPSGRDSNKLAISTDQRVFGDGSLYNDGSSPYGLDVALFPWFCDSIERCWNDARSQNSWSFTFWFQPTSISNTVSHAIISSGPHDRGLRYDAFFAGSPCYFAFNAYGRNRTLLAHIQSDPGIVDISQWVYVGLTWDQVQGIVNLYINGTLTKSNSFSTSEVMNPPSSSTHRIGYMGGSSTTSFTGYIDELSFWDGDLDPTRILYVMHNNTIHPFRIQSENGEHSFDF